MMIAKRSESTADDLRPIPPPSHNTMVDTNQINNPFHTVRIRWLLIGQLPQVLIFKKTWGGGLFAGFFQEADDGFDAQLEVLEVEFFVGGVDAVVGQAEAHHDAGHAQIAIKIANDGDGAAGADKDRVFSPDLFEGAGGGLDEGVVDADQAGVDR